MDRGFQMMNDDDDARTNRDRWEFGYSASALAKAAEGQRDYRDGRAKAWEDKKAEVMEKIRESGLIVHESVAEKMLSYSNNVGPGGEQISIDPALQRDLKECASKIRTHRDASKEYDCWVQVLKANSEERLKLTHADWMFFFGK